MAPLLHHRLVCFYCGRRSGQRKTANLQQWQCEVCEAVNHLDENGEITDPPALETSSNIRYARSTKRPASPVFAPSDETLFCATCLKNQHLLTQSLASYLPSTTHPEYDTYEASFPKYRERLEEEYPQVCEKCEPRVRKRIRATGYAAKADHLRRMMERTRGGVRSQQKLDWRYIIVYLGAIGCWAGLIGGILWDALGAITVPNDGFRDSDETSSVLSCLQHSVRARGVGQHCMDEIQPLARWALGMSILSFWWNPRLSTKVQGRGGRMVGLSEYYKLHGLSLATRSVVLYTLRGSTGSQLSHQSIKAIHAFMVVFALVMSRISYRAVQMDNTPLVIFQDNLEPLISEKQRRVQSTSGQVQSTLLQSNISSFEPLSQTRLQPFPVSTLAPTPQRPYNPPYQSPTPPPDDFEDDVMDWTPSQKSTFRPVQPKTNVLKPTLTQIQPSPFHGCLPPAPISQAHKLRNPQNQPTFHKASSNQQQNFFNRMTNRSPKKNDDDHSEDEDDNPAAPSNFSTPGRFDMAQPRFFPQPDHRADTGLESLFTAAFSLKDEPPEVRAARELQNNKLSLQRRPNPGWTAMQRAGSITLLGSACLAWSFASTHPEYAQLLRLIALGIAAAVAGRGLLEAFQVEKDVWRFSDIMIFVVELALAIYLGSIVKSSKLDYEPALGMIPMWLLGFMLFQEIVTFARELKASSAAVPASASAAVPAPAPSSPGTHTSTEEETFADSGFPKSSSYTITLDKHGLPDAYSKSKVCMSDNEIRIKPWGELIEPPRVTRSKSSKAKRESLIPSSSLSGLSLGLDQEPRSGLSTPKFETWGGEKSTALVTRNTRSKGLKTEPWGRGTL